MSKIYEIQETVPICQECGGGLKLNKISQTFLCMHCGSKYRVIGLGKNDRILICEKREEGTK